MNKVIFCDRCDICASNKHLPVWGFGNTSANIMFIGEAPGATERRLNLPFVGKSGQALRRIMDLYGFTNNNTYITNIVKCRPPMNRTPELNEIANCMEYIIDEIQSVNPQIIVLVGSTALRTFYNDFSLSITVNNGRFEYVNGKIIIAMFHPSYLLRNPDKLGEFEQTMNRILYLYRLKNPTHVTKL